MYIVDHRQLWKRKKKQYVEGVSIEIRTKIYENKTINVISDQNTYNLPGIDNVVYLDFVETFIFLGTGKIVILTDHNHLHCQTRQSKRKKNIHLIKRSLNGK